MNTSFEFAYREHLPYLQNYARNLAGQDADDLLQDGALRMWRSWDKRKDTSRPKAWLAGVLLHAHQDRLRADTRDKRKADAIADELTDANHPLTYEAEEIENRIDLDSVVKTLKPMHQRIWTMTFDGYTNPEIGKALGIPSTSVSSLKRSSRAKLREALA